MQRDVYVENFYQANNEQVCVVLPLRLLLLLLLAAILINIATLEPLELHLINTILNIILSDLYTYQSIALGPARYDDECRTVCSLCGQKSAIALHAFHTQVKAAGYSA